VTPGGLLFADAAQGPLRRQTFNVTWRAAIKQAGIPTGVGVHDLRHTYASTLISAGVSVRAVAANLGHKDPMITLRTHAHLMPDDDDRTRAAVAEFFARADQMRTSEAGSG
jgi:integrase